MILMVCLCLICKGFVLRGLRYGIAVAVCVVLLFDRFVGWLFLVDGLVVFGGA